MITDERVLEIAEQIGMVDLYDDDTISTREVGSNEIIAFAKAIAKELQRGEAVEWKVVPPYEDEQGYLDYTDNPEAVKALQAKGWKCEPLFTTPQVPEGWISVKDRLPKERQSVLCSDGQNICIGYLRIWSESKFFVTPHYGITPTHWQPLPAAPTKE